jgi:hypothetical protein
MQQGKEEARLCQTTPVVWTHRLYSDAARADPVLSYFAGIPEYCLRLPKLDLCR